MKQCAYEGLFLLDASRAASDFKAAIGEIEDFLKRAESEVLMCIKWDERRLAYDIKGHKKGTYLLAYFRAPGANIAEIERRCRLSPTVLRTLILQVPERELENLMAKAQAPSAPDSWDRDRDRRGGPPRMDDRRPAPAGAGPAKAAETETKKPGPPPADSGAAEPAIGEVAPAEPDKGVGPVPAEPDASGGEAAPPTPEQETT